MDSAEQAALSEANHDPQGQSQILTKKVFEPHHFVDFGSDSKMSTNGKKMKPLRRFDKLSVNLSLSSILVPSGVDLNGNWEKNP